MSIFGRTAVLVPAKIPNDLKPGWLSLCESHPREGLAGSGPHGQQCTSILPARYQQADRSGAGYGVQGSGFQGFTRPEAMTVSEHCLPAEYRFFSLNLNAEGKA